LTLNHHTSFASAKNSINRSNRRTLREPGTAVNASNIKLDRWEQQQWTTAEKKMAAMCDDGP
jgi:hypothetical protein